MTWNQGKGGVLAAKAVATQGGLAAKAVATQSKGSGLAAKAVATQGKGSVFAANTVKRRGEGSGLPQQGGRASPRWRRPAQRCRRRSEKIEEPEVIRAI